MTDGSDGDVSVMPQPWRSRNPSRSSNRSMSERGSADPPHTTNRSDETSNSWSSPYRNRSAHTVGTAAETVGRSAAMNSASGSACRNRSGINSAAPDRKAA